MQLNTQNLLADCLKEVLAKRNSSDMQFTNAAGYLMPEPRSNITKYPDKRPNREIRGISLSPTQELEVQVWSPPYRQNKRWKITSYALSQFDTFTTINILKQAIKDL